MAGCVRCSRAAAREKLRSDATVRKTCSSARSMIRASILPDYATVKIIILTNSRGGASTNEHGRSCGPRFRHHPPRRRASARLLDARRGKARSWPVSSTPWAWTSSRRASRSPPRTMPKSVRRVASEVRRPVIAALARCAPADIDAPARPSNPPHAAASTPSSPPPTCIWSASCASRASSASSAPSRR